MTRDEKRIKELEEALRPFAQFAAAYKEWRFGKNAILLQNRTEAHVVTARWVQPQPKFYTREVEDTMQIRELRAGDFIHAEEILAREN